MRDLILSGGPWTREEQQQILDYCHDDVRATKALLARMVACLDVPQALLRGRYVGAVAHMEANGIPLDGPLLDTLRTRWDEIRRHLISAVDSDYGVYDGMTFKQARWATWLQERDIPWPRLESGALELKDETFRTMTNTYPEVASIYDLRSTLSKLRLNDLAVGTDGRNRTLMSPFGSKSSRCTPRASQFVFGPARWIRGLIKPEPGRALAYLDWDQQEFVIAAALSRDANMLKAAHLGDPYLALAKFAGAAPECATKQTHGAVRNLYKSVTLGVQYGMGPAGLAARTGKSQLLASHLLGQYRDIYPQFWRWSDAVVARAYDAQSIRTRFGWRLRVGPYGEENERSLRNFPMQATGADMMRVAAVLMIDRGVQVCASIHDAFLIEAAADEIDVQVAIATECMEHASRLTLDGVSVGVGADVIRWPNRYMDERGRAMWETVMGLLKETTAA